MSLCETCKDGIYHPGVNSGHCGHRLCTYESCGLINLYIFNLINKKCCTVYWGHIDSWKPWLAGGARWKVLSVVLLYVKIFHLSDQSARQTEIENVHFECCLSIWWVMLGEKMMEWCCVGMVEWTPAYIHSSGLPKVQGCLNEIFSTYPFVVLWFGST